MEKGFGTAGWLAVGAAVGWIAGRWTDDCGRGGRYRGNGYDCAPGYPGGYAPAPVYPAYPYPAPGYGYPGNDRPHHEDRQDEKISAIQAQLAALCMSDKKNEEIDALRYNLGMEITDGKIFRGTCRKIDGSLGLPINKVTESYHGTPNIVATYPMRHYGNRGDCGKGYQDGFGDEGYNW